MHQRSLPAPGHARAGRYGGRASSDPRAAAGGPARASWPSPRTERGREAAPGALPSRRYGARGADALHRPGVGTTPAAGTARPCGCRAKGSWLPTGPAGAGPSTLPTDSATPPTAGSRSACIRDGSGFSRNGQPHRPPPQPPPSRLRTRLRLLPGAADAGGGTGRVPRVRQDPPVGTPRSPPVKSAGSC